MNPLLGAVTVFKILRALKKGSIGMDTLKNLFSSGAWHSKTIWFGIAQLLLPLVTTYLHGGPITLPDLLPVLTGLGTLFGRANPDIKSLAAK